MNCKKCRQELPEGTTLCPACGEENAWEEETLTTEETCEELLREELPEAAEETAEPVRKNTWKKVVAFGCCIVLVLGLAAGIFATVNGGFKIRENDIHYKDSYTVDADKALAAHDKVVATYGDHTLTNGQLQVYYWMQITDFLNEYYSYLSMIGLDYTKPLDTQIYDEESGTTWQQYFLGGALAAWERYQMLDHLARENGYELTGEVKEYMDSLPEEMKKIAETYQYDSVDAMVRELYFGTGSSYQAYEDFLRTYYNGFLYFNDEYEKIVPTDEQIEAYYNEHAEEFASSGIAKENGSQYAVRHILVLIGDEDDEAGKEYTEDEWKACEAEAQAILDAWLAGDKSEESFAKLANEKSEDGGSNTNGGLYEGLTKDTNFVPTFKEWYLDENRQSGDTGLVKSDYGYHVMYFVSSEQMWYVNAAGAVIAQQLNEGFAEQTKDIEPEIDFKKIVLGELSLT